MHNDPSMSGFNRSSLNAPSGPEKMPPLGHAIRRADTALVKKLIDMGAETYFTMPDGRVFNAVAEATFWGRDLALEYMIAKGAGQHINKPSLRGPSCLAVAVQQRQDKIAALLVKAGAFIDAPVMPNGMTPLQSAAHDGQSALAGVLIDLGADLNRINPQTGLSAMHAVIKMCDSEAVGKAIRRGGDIHARTRSGETPLMLAAARYNSNIAAQIVKQGADVNAKSDNEVRETALHIAARQGNTETAIVLLDAGASPLLTDAFNATAAKRAKAGHSRELGFILDRAEHAAEQAFFDKAWREVKNKGKGNRP